MDEGIEEKTIKLVLESMNRFKLEFETACIANGISKDFIEQARAMVSKMGITISKNVGEVKKRAVKKKVGDICGNEKEIGDILNFIHDRETKKLLVLGKENSGKTMTIDEAFKRANVYHEEVFEIKEFLSNKTYNIRRLLPVIFIVDVSGQEKAFTGSKQFKAMLVGSIVSKVIVVCREMDEGEAERFEMVVEIKSPGFTESMEFLAARDPELLEGIVEDKARKIFEESGGNLFNFTRALMAKDYSPDLSKSDFDLAIKLCSEIYKEKDRFKVRSDLEKHLKANEKDKTESMFKVIPYFNFLEHYVAENTYRFFNVLERTFYDVTLMLDKVHARRFYIDIDDILDYLSFGIPAAESDIPVILPYIHEYLVYAKTKKKAFAKKKAKEDE